MRKVAFVQNVTAFNYSEESRFLNILTEVKKEYVSTSVIIRFWCNEHHLGYFCSPPKIKGTAFLTALCNTIFQYRITFYAYSNTFTLLLHGWFLIAKLQKTRIVRSLHFSNERLPDKYDNLPKQTVIKRNSI